MQLKKVKAHGSSEGNKQADKLAREELEAHSLFGWIFEYMRTGLSDVICYLLPKGGKCERFLYGMYWYSCGSFLCRVSCVDCAG